MATRYVVRAETGAAVEDVDGPGVHYCEEEPTEHLSAAISEWFWATESGDKVRIYAVGEDGQETPLPTYAEALAHHTRRL